MPLYSYLTMHRKVPVSLLPGQTEKGKLDGQTGAQECSGHGHRVLHRVLIVTGVGHGGTCI